MAYFVGKNCIGTKDRSCVEVCPVDCFYNFADPALNAKFGKSPKKRDGTDEDDVGMLVINPDECINCGACETECPVEAIREDTADSTEDKEFIKLNETATAALSDEELDSLRVTSK